MIKNLICLKGHLGWRLPLCNTEASKSTRKNKRTMASINVSTVGGESVRVERNSDHH